MLRKSSLSFCLFCCVGVAFGASKTPESKNAADADRDAKISYGMGVEFATNLKRMGVNVNVDKLTKGFRDSYAGKKLEIEDKEMNALMVSHMSETRERQLKMQKDRSEENQKLGREFLDRYAKQSGVIKLPSGVLYRVIQSGSGPRPGQTDTVQANYIGRSINGKEFDSSSQHGGPVTFNIQGVIPGWQQAIQLMPVGSKWEVAIPPELAYGAKGSGRDIGPFETLVFEIELVSVVQKKNPEEGSEAKP